MSVSEIEQSIINNLKDANEGVSKKSLCKSVMKSFKNMFDSKTDRKSAFSDALKSLVEKGSVTNDEDEIKLVPIVVEKEKKSKKRKAEKDLHESEPDVTTSKTEQKKLKGDEQPKADEQQAIATALGTSVPKVYPVPTGDITILLFYAYCQPQMTRGEQDEAIAFCYKTLSGLGMTGRLRVGREGFNCTLTGKHDSVRSFTAALRKWKPDPFNKTDFKYVDNLPDNQLLKGLKVWPVTEIVTYGFDPSQAPLEMGGTHLSPQEFHEAMAKPNTVVIDVRNFNESLIGKFAPPAVTGEASDPKVLDPCMRRSTEFPGWIDDNRDKLEGKQVLMYCTAGVRCERASAFMRNKGIENVFQLDGGIHRYLDAFPEDGGYWIGKNYTFDKRFNHGAKTSQTISECVFCHKLWDRYQAQAKCFSCAMEVLLCKECQKTKPAPPKNKLFCPLCKK